MKTKKWKRAAAALLAGIFVITAAGCGGNGKEQTSGEEGSSTENSEQEIAKGRYVETIRETPEGVSTILNMVKLSDGSVAFIDENTGKCISQKITQIHGKKRACRLWKKKAVMKTLTLQVRQSRRTAVFFILM